MNRRDIMKGLSVLPLSAGFMAPGAIAATSAAKNPLVDSKNIYESLGIDTVINCRGTFTIIGGSIERPEVIKAIEAASGSFAQYDELAQGVGHRLAELTGAEWGIVTAGCAAAMKHATAACVTGGNPEKLIRIPDLTGMDKTEVIIPRHSRNAYDHAIRNVGVTVISVETPEEMQLAISSRTAMIYLISSRGSRTGEPLSLEACVEMAKPYNIPVLMDAAAENLTVPNFHLERGATMVAYSGGKAICGPQCAGLLLGPKDLMMSAWQASSPHHGPGRDNKVGKEEMLGMVAAVEAWFTRDHDAEWNTWLSWLETISKQVTKVKGVKTEVTLPEEIELNNRAPRLVISWDPSDLNITGDEVAEVVARQKPRLAIGSRDGDGMSSVNITPSQMQAGQEKIVAERLHGILAQKRKPRETKMMAPSGDVSDRWDLTIDFFTSQGEHQLFLEQEGNWIMGSHQGDFSVRELVGSLEGDKIKMRSRTRLMGDNLTYIFHGTLKGDSMEGDIHLGEYLTAKFKATRNPHSKPSKEIMVPGGPPLAT